MRIQEYIITADEDKWLTQSTVINDNNRVYTKQLRLGRNDKADNWRDADETEKLEFEERMKNPPALNA